MPRLPGDLPRTVFNPASVTGTCDACHSPLYQRPDDTRKVVANRVDVYLRDTLPLVERYQRQGILERVDGNQPIEAVRLALRHAVCAIEALPA